MNYIEFLGAPGVGKSTILSQLVDSDQFFGGVEDDAVKRTVIKKVGFKYRLLYNLTPSIITRFFEDALFEYRFGHSALEEFIRDYPDFIKTLSSIMDTAEYEPEKIFSFCKRSAERYQMSISTVEEDEILCLDESFAQRAVSILWRCSSTTFSLEEYFSAVPIPDLVVHVDAPTNVCLDRQHKRGRLTVAKDWNISDIEQVQERLRRICLKIRKYLAGKTSVIEVQNTDTVETTFDEISSKVSKLQRES